jgi:hypothetical protein
MMWDRGMTIATRARTTQTSFEFESIRVNAEYTLDTYMLFCRTQFTAAEEKSQISR